VFAIPGTESENDTGLTMTDMTMLIPYCFVELALKNTEEADNTAYIYFLNGQWLVADVVPIEIDNKCVVKVKSGKIISHDYFVTI